MKSLLHSYIMILPDPETRDHGGFILPDTAVKKSKTGIVMMIGENCTLGINVHDRVLYNPAIATDYTHEGKNHVIIRPQDLIAII